MASADHHGGLGPTIHRDADGTEFPTGSIGASKLSANHSRIGTHHR